MKKLTVQLGEKSYPVFIGNNILSQSLITSFVKGEQVLVVTNDVVAPLYLQDIKSQFKHLQCDEIILPDGEQYKTLDTTKRIFDTLISKKHLRSTTLIALGGGVIGDITGFAAACYQRGVNFIQLPTTLLAQVDSSVGGKTGVNHPLAKNMIGAFHQPQAVFIDIATLQTLPDREYCSGLAEVIKAGLIQDSDFFDWLESHLAELLAREPDAVISAIQKSVEIKIKLVVADEREANVRALLNLGHTFGHAIEQLTGYSKFLHGEAVSIGMVLAAQYAYDLQWLDKKSIDRIKNILTMAKLPIRLPNSIAVKQMIACMHSDKKKDIVGLRLVLLKGIGQAELTQQVDPTLLEKVIIENQALGKSMV